MSTTYVLGAGASSAYSDSRTNVRPPLARGFFKAYADLDISGDFDVRVGDIVNYARDRYGLPRERFMDFNEDAETFMTAVDDELNGLAARVQEWRATKDTYSLVQFAHLVKVYDQMIFLFAHVLNEIQQGLPCVQYCRLANLLHPSDTVITFNWDTLLDRALELMGSWKPGWGYNVAFRSVFEDGWRAVAGRRQDESGAPTYLKLHGSLNWLVNYVTRDLRDGSRGMVQEKTWNDGWTSISLEPNFAHKTPGVLSMSPEIRRARTVLRPIPAPDEPEALPICFVSGSRHYKTYKDLYREGYVRFSYFFPPNNEAGIATMPLIVPPTRVKLYQEFSHILDPLWTLAEEALRQSDNVVIIGFSFAPTDLRVRQLFKAALRSSRKPTIHVVNPSPDSVLHALVKDIGFPSELVKWLADSFDEYLRLRGSA